MLKKIEICISFGGIWDISIWMPDEHVSCLIRGLSLRDVCIVEKRRSPVSATASSNLATAIEKKKHRCNVVVDFIHRKIRCDSTIHCVKIKHTTCTVDLWLGDLVHQPTEGRFQKGILIQLAGVSHQSERLPKVFQQLSRA